MGTASVSRFAGANTETSRTRSCSPSMRTHSGATSRRHGAYSGGTCSIYFCAGCRRTLCDGTPRSFRPSLWVMKSRRCLPMVRSSGARCLSALTVCTRRCDLQARDDPPSGRRRRVGRATRHTSRLGQIGSRYERRRRPRIDHVQHMTDKLSRAAGLPGWIRDAILPFLGPRTYRETYGPLKADP